MSCLALDDLWTALADKDLNCAYAEGFHDDGSASDGQIAAAVEAARDRDAAVIVAGLPDSYESEGFDRTSLDMPEGQNRLIAAVAEVNPNVIVILQCGSPVTMPWLDRVRAVLYVGLAGCQGGRRPRPC